MRYLTRISVKESGMTSDKSIKRSRRLLNVYWLYKALSGGNILKATLETLKVEAGASKKQYMDRRLHRDHVRGEASRVMAKEQPSRESKKTGKIRSASGAGLLKLILNKARVI